MGAPSVRPVPDGDVRHSVRLQDGDGLDSVPAFQGAELRGGVVRLRGRQEPGVAPLLPGELGIGGERLVLQRHVSPFSRGSTASPLANGVSP